MLNIVVPMAGRGRRFADAGYTTPKPLIEIHGVPMIKAVIDNLRPACPHRFIFLCLKEHLDDIRIDRYLASWAPGCTVLSVNRVTEGAACTVLLARELIDNSDPLMIANCDQWVDVNINNYLAHLDQAELDGLIMTMSADDPKWSFVRFDPGGEVCEVVEKQVVSNEATVGIYNFRRGAEYVWAADRMIAKELRVNGEFYVAPVYNELIAVGKRLGVYNVGSESKGMHGLGTPADLEKFCSSAVCEKVVRLVA